MPDETLHVSLGETVFNEDGDEIGTIRGFTDDGIVVTNRTGMAALSNEHERTPHEIGEAELMWRCIECGEMGKIDSLPDTCPNCGTRKENLYYWTED